MIVKLICGNSVGDIAGVVVPVVDLDIGIVLEPCPELVENAFAGQFGVGAANNSFDAGHVG